MYAFTKNGQDLGFREALDLFELRTRRLKFLIQRLPIQNIRTKAEMVFDLINSFHDKYILEIDALTYPRKMITKDTRIGEMCAKYLRCMFKLTNIVDPYYYDRSKTKMDDHENPYHTGPQNKRWYVDHILVDSKDIDTPVEYDKENMDFDEWKKSIKKTFPYHYRKQVQLNAYDRELEEHTNDHYTYHNVKQALQDYFRLHQLVDKRGDLNAFDQLWDIHNAINVLTDQQKEAIYLRFYHKYSEVEIAEMWRTTEQNICNTIRKAIRNMVYALETGDYRPIRRGRKKKAA
jgi:hypothetical protein